MSVERVEVLEFGDKFFSSLEGITGARFSYANFSDESFRRGRLVKFSSHVVPVIEIWNGRAEIDRFECRAAAVFGANWFSTRNREVS